MQRKYRIMKDLQNEDRAQEESSQARANDSFQWNTQDQSHEHILDPFPHTPAGALQRLLFCISRPHNCLTKKCSILKEIKKQIYNKLEELMTNTERRISKRGEHKHYEVHVEEKISRMAMKRHWHHKLKIKCGVLVVTIGPAEVANFMTGLSMVTEVVMNTAGF